MARATPPEPGKIRNGFATLVNPRPRGFTKVARPFLIFPGSGGVARAIEHSNPQLHRCVDLPKCFARQAVRSASHGAVPALAGAGRAAIGRARDHVLQPQLAEPDGEERGISRAPPHGRSVSAGRVYGRRPGACVGGWGLWDLRARHRTLGRPTTRKHKIRNARAMGGRAKACGVLGCAASV